MCCYSRTMVSSLVSEVIGINLVCHLVSNYCGLKPDLTKLNDRRLRELEYQTDVVRLTEQPINLLDAKRLSQQPITKDNISHCGF